MGYMCSHAIVVTSYDEKIEPAHAKAVELGCNPSPIMDSPMNGYRSFFVPPDGSKEGWDESNAGNDRRDLFIEWLRSQVYNDLSSWIDWAEVQYGDDNEHTYVVRHSDEEN